MLDDIARRCASGHSRSAAFVASSGDASLQEVVERSDMSKQHQIVVLREGKKMNLSISV